MKKILPIIFLLILSACTTLQDVSKDSKEYHSEGFVAIRNNKQYITIGTENTDKPILLYLHGGPGGAQTPVTFPYFKNLQKDFIVVFWDQRGAGKSFHGIILPKHQTMDSFVEDTKELTLYLKKKFNKEKIYLVGNSWGSLLGIETIKKYPQHYYAYVGTGQVVDLKENYKISYDLMLEESTKNDNKELEENLKSINKSKIKITSFGTASISAKRYYNILKNIEKAEATKIAKTRLSIKLGKEDIEEEYSRALKKSFTKSKIAYNSCIINMKINFLYHKLWKEIKNINLRKEITRVNVPVYFAGGRKDMHTPYTLLEEYYNLLEAPKKELIWFENSGHGAEYQEPEKFAELMLQVQSETLTGIN